MLIDKRDFKIIKTNEEDHLLLYSSNCQLFPLDNDILKEYFEICEGNIRIEDSKLSVKDIAEIYEFVTNQFKNSEAPTINNKIEDQIESIILPIAGKCNLYCSYCFARVDNKFQFDSISNDDAKKIIDSIFKNTKSNKLTITFFGGEPMLNFSTLQFVVEFIKENYPEKNVFYSITTNGTILNQFIIDYLVENKIAILVSIDGPEGKNKHRLFHNGKNSFELVLRNINQLKEQNVNLELRSTIANDSRDFLDIFTFFEDLKIPFNVVFAYDSENKNHRLHKFINIAEIDEQFIKLENYYLTKIKMGDKIYARSIITKLETIAFRVKKYYACSGGHSFFSITNQGDIYSCEHLVGINKYKVGNIHEPFSIQNITLMSSNVELIKACNGCWAKWLCSGGCFSANLASTNNQFEPEPSRCMLIKSEWLFIIRLYYRILKFDKLFFKTKNITNEAVDC